MNFSNITRDSQDNASQTFYSGLKRARELEHDAQIFGAYLNAASGFTNAVH
ncbi:MAG: hypothetical protein H0W08_16240 [Acidobacteria bacterium]|nr:hypothetical protein [Acidobacteriota bacterium]